MADRPMASAADESVGQYALDSTRAVVDHFREDEDFGEGASSAACDRCGAPRAATFTECSTCGPVPLCAECVALHRREMEWWDA